MRMKNMVSYHAAKAGCIASLVTEETASSLLLDEFTAGSTMFYTKPKVEFAERTHKLREALKAAASLPQDQRRVKIAELRHSLQDLMASQGRPRRAAGRDHPAPHVAGNCLVRYCGHPHLYVSPRS
jgi:hypothetical protein